MKYSSVFQGLALCVLASACGDDAPRGSGGSGGADSTAAVAGGAPPKPMCRDEPPCGDFSEGCSACAAATTCARAYSDCLSSSACGQFSRCREDCATPTCIFQCATLNEEGAALRATLDACIRCDVCAVACDDPSCAGY